MKSEAYEIYVKANPREVSRELEKCGYSSTPKKEKYSFLEGLLKCGDFVLAIEPIGAESILPSGLPFNEGSAIYFNPERRPIDCSDEVKRVADFLKTGFEIKAYVDTAPDESPTPEHREIY